MNNKTQREPIDRKYMFFATGTESGSEHSHLDSIIFLAKDKALPDVLRYYENKCQELGASVEQLAAIELLIERVVRYQFEHPKEVKVADVQIPDVAMILAKNETD